MRGKYDTRPRFIKATQGKHACDAGSERAETTHLGAIEMNDVWSFGAHKVYELVQCMPIASAYIASERGHEYGAHAALAQLFFKYPRIVRALCWSECDDRLPFTQQVRREVIYVALRPAPVGFCDYVENFLHRKNTRQLLALATTPMPKIASKVGVRASGELAARIGVVA